MVALLLLTVWYGLVGHSRSKDWVSELVLWTRACEIAPNKYRPHINRAKALFGVGREFEGTKEVETALKLWGTDR